MVPQKLDIKPPACPLLGIDAKKKKKKNGKQGLKQILVRQCS